MHNSEKPAFSKGRDRHLYSPADSPVYSSAMSRSGDWQDQHPHGRREGRQSRSRKSAGFFGGELAGQVKKVPGVWAVFESSEEDSNGDREQPVRRRTRVGAQHGECNSDKEGLKREKGTQRRRISSDDGSDVGASVESSVAPRRKRVLIDGSEEEEEDLRQRKRKLHAQIEKVEEYSGSKEGSRGGRVQLGKERRKKAQEVNNLDSEEDREITKSSEGTDKHTGKGRKQIRDVSSDSEPGESVWPETKKGKVVHGWQDGEDQNQNGGQKVGRRTVRERVKQEKKEDGAVEERKNQAFTGVQLDTSEDSDLPLIPTRRRKHQKSLPDMAAKIGTDGDNHDDEDDPPVVKFSRRRSKPGKSIRPSGHSGPGPSYSQRRLKSAGESPPAVGEESDLVSDVELAAHTPVLKSRTRYGDSGKKLTPFQRKLKHLKAKREGVELTSSSEGRDLPVWAQGRALYDSSDSSEDSVDNYEENGNATGDEKAVDTDEEAPVASQIINLDSDIDSFIVSDSDADPLGAPDSGSDVDTSLTPRIPIQFTSHSHASLKSHFKTVVQYILNLILNPGFPRHDEYFTFALHALDRRVDSLRDSVLKSEVWKSDFMLALKSRPHFEYDPDGGNGTQDHCYACNRSDRDASYTVRFTGTLYDRETLEDYSSRSSRRGSGSGSDGDSSTPSITPSSSSTSVSEDEMGNIIPSSGHPFPVGRFCCERAEITHSFWHWKKALRIALEQALEHMGVFAEADALDVHHSMGPKHRWRWATSKLEALEKAGDVDLLWNMFCVQLSRAQEFMVRKFFPPLFPPHFPSVLFFFPSPLSYVNLDLGSFLSSV